MADSNIPQQQFRATRWSLVLKTRGEGVEAKQALEDLCQIYWFPLYAWSRRYGLSASDAEDMVQGFFYKLLEKRLFDSADATRGKLRTFLLTILQRHIKDEQGKARTLRRGGDKTVSFDAAQAEEWYIEEEVEGESADHLYDRQWALTVLSLSISQLEENAAKRGKTPAFEAMRPFLNGEGKESDYQSAGAPLGMTAGSFKVAVHRLRAKFKETLREKIRETQPEDSSADEEIEYLWKVLSGI